MLTLAGIDIGTNTLRLLIAEFSPDGSYRQIESNRQVTRLGEEISRTGRLKAGAMERTIGVLEEFSRTCSRYPVAGIYTVATSAVREASNGADFVRRVKERAGLDVEVISGDEEARLTMLGVSSGLDIEGKDVLLMDIGGGSTEFVSVSKGEISFKVSTDIGVVRFTEQYIHSDPPESGEIEALDLAIKKRLGTLPVFLKRKNTGSVPEILIGTAGTVTTLAAIEQRMTVYDPDKVNGFRIRRDRIQEIRRALSRMTIKEREQVPGLEKGREDIIVAGVVVVDEVMEWFGFGEIVVSDSGLREGLVIDLHHRLSKG